MCAHYVEYPLQDGFVANWLVAGPQAIAVTPGRFVTKQVRRERWASEFKGELFRRYFSAKAGIGATPVERGPVDAGRFTIGKYEGSWSYYACPPDHTVDHSGYYVACHYLRSWAYIEVVSQRQQRVVVVVTGYGPLDLWAGEKHLLRVEQGDKQGEEGFVTHTIVLQLGAGVTPLLVRFENVGMGHIRHAMRLRFCDATGEKAAAGVHLRFRTLIEEVERRNAFEKLSAAAFVERDVYAGETPIVLRWPEGGRANCFAHVRLQTADGRIYLAGDSAGGAGEKLQMGNALQLPVGPLHATLMPNPNEVYLQHLRIFRSLPVWSLGRLRYHATPWSDIAGRRNELLTAAARSDHALFAQLARMALGVWGDPYRTSVDGKALLAAIEGVQRREAGSNLHLLALLGMLYRWGEHPQFPAEVRGALEACALGYRYWRDDAGFDLMNFESGANPLLFHACEVLAGQLYPQREFGDGQKGEWHGARGEELAKQWITSFGAYGSAAWNSPQSMEQEMAALLHLCDFAEAEELFEMATVALDKVFFLLALHTWHGVWGAAGQRSSASVVKSGLLQPLAPICNLMWGMGIFNHHVAGVLSLANSTNYEMPLLFARIAQEFPEEVWSREQHAPAAGQEANIVTYKTPEYMLSSLQDYRAGEQGDEEMVWRVTMGAEAVIFATHPGSASESDSRSPGYWAGNGRLPRVAQWKDALAAIYQLDEDDLFGFTHAYFPVAAFDEYGMRGGWLFGRKGDGYVALTNSHGVAMVMEERYALREVRAEGRAQCWLVQMGRAALDGDFASFQEKALALPLRFGEGTVEYTTLRGDHLRFGWQGPLLVNDEVEPLSGFRHYENVYTTTELGSGQMEVQWAGEGLRLDFGG
jgi:hypothetical protein